MSLRDIKLLAIALVPVLVLVVLAYLAPIYHMPNGTYERHWRWNAPTRPVGHGYDLMKPEDIERLSKDPVQKQILENMKNMPRSMPIEPHYIGSRWGPGRNTLGYIAMMSVVLWCLFAGHKWFNR
jgi:hypothetical protein